MWRHYICQLPKRCVVPRDRNFVRPKISTTVSAPQQEQNTKYYYQMAASFCFSRQCLQCTTLVQPRLLTECLPCLLRFVINNILYCNYYFSTTWRVTISPDNNYHRQGSTASHIQQNKYNERDLFNSDYCYHFRMKDSLNDIKRNSNNSQYFLSAP